MTDLYAAIDGDPSMSEDELRRAYRAKAKKVHPDVNHEPGAREEFERASFAITVLSDPKRRKRYDETGQAEDTINDEVRSILDDIGNLLALIVLETQTGLEDPAQKPVMTMMAHAITVAREDLESRVKMDKKALEKWKRIAGRFRAVTTDGEVSVGMIESAVLKQMAILENGIADKRDSLDQLDKLEALFSGVGFEQEAQRPFFQDLDLEDAEEDHWGNKRVRL